MVTSALQVPTAGVCVLRLAGSWPRGLNRPVLPLCPSKSRSSISANRRAANEASSRLCSLRSVQIEPQLEISSAGPSPTGTWSPGGTSLARHNRPVPLSVRVCREARLGRAVTGPRKAGPAECNFRLYVLFLDGDLFFKLLCPLQKAFYPVLCQDRILPWGCSASSF